VFLSKDDEQGHKRGGVHGSFQRDHRELNGFQSCPACPELKKKIDRIDLALLGDDGTGMKSGIVYALTQLQKVDRVQDSWVNTLKPIMVAVVTSVFTFALTYGLLHFGV
jgi:hypothetical protein